jgi:anti-sigma B factor antagonist
VGSICEIETVKRDDALIILVSGEIDLSTGSDLDAALTRAEAGTATLIVVDLERVTFMDATGLGILVRHSTSAARDSRVRLTPGPPQVRRLFELSGVRSHLPFRSPS